MDPPDEDRSDDQDPADPHNISWTSRSPLEGYVCCFPVFPNLFFLTPPTVMSCVSRVKLGRVSVGINRIVVGMG